MPRLLKFLTLLLLALGVNAPAHALLSTCTVTAVGVSFGGYNPLSATPLDSTGQVSVICVGLDVFVNYTIALSAGGSGSYAPRQMSFLTNRLNYNLYTSSSRTTVWGNGTSGTSMASGSYVISLGVADNWTVYGRVTAQQNRVAGAYTDTVTVTVNY